MEKGSGEININTKIIPYNTEQRTEMYITQLEKWIKKISVYKYNSKFSVDNERLKKLKFFPINTKRDILLIIEPKSFASHVSGQRLAVRDNNLKEKTCKVLRLFDNTKGNYYGPSDGGYDLEVITNDNNILYVDPHFVAYATSSLPPYVFLPFPERLKDFGKFLRFFAEKPKRLEGILREYYNGLHK